MRCRRRSSSRSVGYSRAPLFRSCGSRRTCHSRTPGSGESARRVQRDGPVQICADHTQDKCHVHDAEQHKEKEGIRKEAAADDEFHASAEIQEGIRWPALGVFLPNSQELFGTPDGKAMPLPCRGEETGESSKKEKTAPGEEHFRAEAPPL